MIEVRVLFVCAAILAVACGSGKCKNYDPSTGTNNYFFGTYSCVQEPSASEYCLGWQMCSGASILRVSAVGTRAKITSDDCWWSNYEYEGGLCEPEKNNSNQEYFTFYGSHTETMGDARVRSTIDGQILVGEGRTTATANITLDVTPDFGMSCKLHGRLTCECTSCY